jgi:SAM-dependent methyltransferase
VREALRALHTDEPALFAEIFLRGETVRASPSGLSVLEGAGLVERAGRKRIVPRARVFPILGKLVAADLPTHRAPDQVFSLMFEQVYVVRNFSAGEGDRVLELCAGSGVNSLFAADRASSVVGTDVNPRAIAFAEFNRAVEEPAAPVEFREGSLFEPVAGDEFDLVLVNPPFELVPEGETWFQHSDGGEDGLAVARRCLESAPRFLAPAGRFEIITWSPGARTEPLLVRMLEETFPDRRVEVHVLDVLDIEVVCRRFRRASSYAAWQDRLRERAITHCHFIFARAAPREGDEPKFRATAPEDEVALCREIAAEWPTR